MLEGTCYLSVIPVRSEPSSKTILVNQLLYGDRVKIIDETIGWYKIISLHDNYEGWCEINQIVLDGNNFDSNPQRQLISDITATFSNGNHIITLVYGSEIRLLDGYLVLIAKNYRLVSGTARSALEASGQNLVFTGQKLLNSPYLWGGRSPFGIDCSGLIQIAFKMTGIRMPRDAWQQAETEGEYIDLIAEARPGDIAFFDNADGRIIHTGILTGAGTIIHANGKVREDPVDHNGIFNKELGAYTHKLRVIKRFVNA